MIESVYIDGIYIDGFNLYYGSIAKRPKLKWLDLAEMCRRLLPNHDINKIRYFTSRIDAWKRDQDAPKRQDIYLRALETIPNLTIHFGRFATRPVRMPRYPIPPAPQKLDMVDIVKTEEKRSDVNLATYLLLDCFDDDFEQAVIVSNDSDLMLPAKIVRERFRKPIGMINPHPRGKLSSELVKWTTFQIGSINLKVLANSQFTETLADDKGRFSRPPRWS